MPLEWLYERPSTVPQKWLNSAGFIQDADGIIRAEADPWQLQIPYPKSFDDAFRIGAPMVDPRAYSIGFERDEAWVVMPDRSYWTFYYSERGQKNSQRWFRTEEEAGAYAASEIFNGVFYWP